MSQRRLRILLLGTLLLLPAQFLLATRVARFHPALHFPFFEGVPGHEGTLALEHRSLSVLYADGSAAEHTAEALFPELPDYVRTKSARSVLPRASFQNGALSEEQRAWLRARLERLGPGPPREALLHLALRVHDARDAVLLRETPVSSIRVAF